MRTLFISTPVLSHVLPIIPLAWAMRAAGHDVVVATSGVAGHVQRAGLTAVDVAPGFDLATWEQELLRTFPDIAELTALQAHGLRFAALNDAMAEGLATAIDAWCPELVVYSEVAVIAVTVADAFGVPAVRHGIEICDTSRMLGHVVDALTTAFGHPDVAGARHPRHVLSVVPPSLTAGRHCDLAMRYPCFNGGHVLSERPVERLERPSVVVSLGTSTPSDKPGRLARVVAAASEIDAEFVLAVDPAVVRRHAPLPANVRASGWVPLTVLLRTSSAMIHHGGAGTTMNAASVGVPQLIVPDDVPRHLNAQAVCRRGAALHLRAEQVDATTIRHLLEDASLLQAAAQLSAEIAAMPTAAQTAQRLEQLVTTK